MNPNSWIGEHAFTFSKIADDDSRRIVGTASSGTVDRQGQRVDMRSLAKAAKAYLKRNPILFFQHDWNAAIGRVNDARVEGSGDEARLVIEAEIGKGFKVPFASGMTGTTIDVDDIWTQIKQRIIRSFSIGFNASVIQKENEPPTLTEIDLFEVSVVSVPANPDATFSVAKSLSKQWATAEDPATMFYSSAAFLPSTTTSPAVFIPSATTSTGAVATQTIFGDLTLGFLSKGESKSDEEGEDVDAEAEVDRLVELIRSAREIVASSVDEELAFAELKGKIQCLRKALKN